MGANKDFEQAINGLQKGEVSPPVSLPGNRIALAVVTAIVPTHPATLEESEATDPVGYWNIRARSRNNPNALTSC